MGSTDNTQINIYKKCMISRSITCYEEKSGCKKLKNDGAADLNRNLLNNIKCSICNAGRATYVFFSNLPSVI